MDSPFAFPPEGMPNLPADFDLNRLLASSDGPVNWEVAAVVATQMAGDAGAEPRWSEVEDDYAGLVRAAEVPVTEYTGLSAPKLLAPVQVVSRARWCDLHLRAFEPMIVPLAGKLASAQAASVQPGQEPFANMFRAMMPFLLGAQAGTMVGWLSHHVLGRYDLQVPPPAEGGLVFVAPNLEAAERDLNVVPFDFKFWLALHEVVRAIEYGQPGVREQFPALARDVADAIRIDPDQLASLGSLQDFDMSDPASMQRILDEAQDVAETMVEPGHEEALERLEAYFGIIEGYAAHVTQHVGSDRIPSLAEIEEAITARRLTAESDDVFQQMLGVEVRRRQFEPAKLFCDAVVETEDIDALNRVWRSPEDRPTLEEIHDPDLWLARTVGRRG